VSLRDSISKYPVGGIAFALCVLALAVGMIGRFSKPQGVSLADKVYFFDLGSGELFVAARAMLPVDAPKGGAGKGVRVSVFSCGVCDEATWEIGYLTTFSDEAAAVIRNPPSSEQDPNGVVYATMMERGEMIALPPEAGKQPRWVLRNSPTGRDIAEKYYTSCNGKPAQACLPK